MRVLLADDHQLLRQALRRALEEQGATVVAEASDGDEAARYAGELQLDVVVMDVTMPVLGGIEATRRIHSRQPQLPIVMLTMHGEQALRQEAIAAGASAFLTKDCSMQEVVETVVQTAGGEVAFSTGIAAAILHELGGGAAPDVSERTESPLTPREEEILQLIADGCSTTEVADHLYISQKTVKNHLASIYAKLDARDRTQAVLSAVRIGIVRLN
jgi:two-component system, NarL family, response regulator DegU